MRATALCGTIVIMGLWLCGCGGNSESQADGGTGSGQAGAILFNTPLGKDPCVAMFSVTYQRQ
jgi:hypothetical protein